MTLARTTLIANSNVAVMTTDAIEEPAAIEGTALLVNHREWIETIIRRRVENRHVADEIFQEVSVSILQQPNRLQDAAKVRPWLFQVVTRRIADHYRRQYQEIAGYDVLRETFDNADERESWQWLAETEQAETVSAALAELDEEDRQLLVGKFRDRWTYEQIAKHFDCTVRSAEHRLIRAKSRLRLLLVGVVFDSENEQ